MRAALAPYSSLAKVNSEAQHEEEGCARADFA